LSCLRPKTLFCKAGAIHFHLCLLGLHDGQLGLFQIVREARLVRHRLGSLDHAEAQEWAKPSKSWSLCLSQALTFHRDDWTCTN
jgi:hypothetical protein